MSKKKTSIDDLIALFYPSPKMFDIMPTRTALLLVNLMDYTKPLVQTAVQANFPREEAIEALSDFEQRSQKAAVNAAKLLKACRSKGFEIVHVNQARTSSHSGMNSVSSPETKDSKGYEEVAPKKGELVFHSKGADAFVGTKLDQVLKNMNVDSLIICGFETEHDVLFTTVQAVNLDYQVILAFDACATFKEKIHEIFIDWYKTFVIAKTTEEILNLIT